MDKYQFLQFRGSVASIIAGMALFCFLAMPLAHASQEVSEKDLSPAQAIQNTPAQNAPVQNPPAEVVTLDNTSSPAKDAKEDFSGGFKTVGSGFKHGTKATGHAFKKTGVAMGHGFKKAGSGLKWFFTGQWIKKKSDVEERNVVGSSETTSVAPTPAMSDLPASDLDAVGNELEHPNKPNKKMVQENPASDLAVN